MSPYSPIPGEVVKLDLSAGSVHTVLHDGKPHVVLKPAIDELALDYSTQVKKLNERSWATVGQSPMVAEDGKTRDMTVVPVRTFLMLLATINENRVSAKARPILVAFQNETADAIEAYWTRGGAINPAASLEQADALRRELDSVDRARLAEARLSAMGVAKQYGLVNPSYVESMARHELARMSGVEPDLDPADVTITADEFLSGKGVVETDLPSARVRLGRTVSALYKARYGQPPQKIKRPIHGVHRDVAVYTHRDIDLFDTAWAELGRHYDVQGHLEGGAA